MKRYPSVANWLPPIMIAFSRTGLNIKPNSQLPNVDINKRVLLNFSDKLLNSPYKLPYIFLWWENFTWDYKSPWALFLSLFNYCLGPKVRKEKDFRHKSGVNCLYPGELNKKAWRMNNVQVKW